MNDPIETWTVAIDGDTAGLQRELKAASQLGEQFSRALVTAFEGVAIKGRGVGDVLRSLSLSLSKAALNAAFKPLEQGLGQLFSGLFSGAGAAFGGGGLGQSLPVPFAKGGVVSSPITFPLGGGHTGLAGERGAEAIMPLTRGADGRLGVVAQGASRVVIAMNISTQDAESFQRSQTQVAAMLSRAVALGARNS